MKKRWLVGLVLCVAACGGKPNGRSPIGGIVTPTAARPSSGGGSAGDADDERARFKSAADDQIKQIRKNGELTEKYFLQQLAIVLGQQPADGVKKKIPLSKAILGLRAVGLKPQLMPSPDIRAGFFVLDDKVIKDFYTARKKRLEPAEQEQYETFMRDIGAISSAASQAQMNALMAHFLVVAHVAYVANIDKYFGVAPNDADVEIARKAMMEERRAENVAAATAGLAATLMTVLGAQKDPKALDDVAQAFMGSTDAVEVPASEAKAFLDGFQNGLGDARARYEAQLSQSLGPDWKKLGIGTFFTESFALAESAANRKTRADERKDEEQKRAARGGGGATDPKAGAGLPSAAQAATMARGLLPSDERVTRGLAAFDALKKGDAKGTANAAMGFVPEGPVKSGLKLVLKLF